MICDIKLTQIRPFYYYSYFSQNKYYFKLPIKTIHVHYICILMVTESRLHLLNASRRLTGIEHTLYSRHLELDT